MTSSFRADATPQGRWDGLQSVSSSPRRHQCLSNTMEDNLILRWSRTLTVLMLRGEDTGEESSPGFWFGLKSPTWTMNQSFLQVVLNSKDVRLWSKSVWRNTEEKKDRKKSTFWGFSDWPHPQFDLIWFLNQRMTHPFHQRVDTPAVFLVDPLVRGRGLRSEQCWLGPLTLPLPKSWAQLQSGSNGEQLRCRVDCRTQSHWGSDWRKCLDGVRISTLRGF